MNFNLTKSAVAEFLGTAFLLAIVVGSGIMGEKLSNGNSAITLLANSLATGGGLIFLILTFGRISGAHFNPLVSLAEVWHGNLNRKKGLVYVFAQITGGIFGVGLANYMFELPVFSVSTKLREGFPQLVSEFIATFGLLAVIRSGNKFKQPLVPFMVAAYIVSAYWFTSSTSFANPAVTIARSLSDTFAGIAPQNVLPFIMAQFVGAVTSIIIFSWLLKESNEK